MHEKVLAAAVARVDILLGCETTQTISIHKGCQHRLNLSDEHVDSEVEFAVVNEVGLRLVLLDDVALVPGDVLNTPSDENALALALVLRLYYEGSALTSGLLPLSEEGIEVEKFIGRDPGLGEELELLGESFLHQFQILS